MFHNFHSDVSSPEGDSISKSLKNSVAPRCPATDGYCKAGRNGQVQSVPGGLWKSMAFHGEMIPENCGFSISMVVYWCVIQKNSIVSCECLRIVGSLSEVLLLLHFAGAKYTRLFLTFPSGGNVFGVECCCLG